VPLRLRVPVFQKGKTADLSLYIVIIVNLFKLRFPIPISIAQHFKINIYTLLLPFPMQPHQY
jgi:hypothetical protein